MPEATATALLSDIGATNARFALLAEGQRLDTTTYAVADYASPVEAAREFLAGPAAGHKPQIAVLAAAGPVVNGRVTMTNAAWTVDADRIRQGLGPSGRREGGGKSGAEGRGQEAAAQTYRHSLSPIRR